MGDASLLSDVAIIALVFGTILVSITFHEAMHAFVAHWLGDDTAYLSGRLTLNPIAHIDPFATILLPILLLIAGLPPFGAAKPVPINPARLRYSEYGSALVAIAGPLTNMALAVLAGLWLRFIIGVDEGITSEIFSLFITVNISFAIFNMIPFPPLDGSRLLYAFAPDALRAFMRQIEAFGLMAIALFIFFVFPLLAVPMINLVDSLHELIVGVPVLI